MYPGGLANTAVLNTPAATTTHGSTFRLRQGEIFEDYSQVRAVQGRCFLLRLCAGMIDSNKEQQQQQSSLVTCAFRYLDILRPGSKQHSFRLASHARESEREREERRVRAQQLDELCQTSA